ncbi:MAG TPA: alpha/beta hydrolase [Chthoniobacterales bacterium]
MVSRLILLFCLPAMLMADTPQTPLHLWEKNAPGAKGTQPTDIPTLTPYLPAPEKATGAAIVVCPGGGYFKLAPHEGDGYARWLSGQGIAAFVLKYRLGASGYRHPVMLNDAARAVRTVRANAAKWNVDPQRIGIMGSSAGGHLAATLLTHFDAGNAASTDPVERVSSRPDIGILCYPVITMGPLTHQGSKDNLLGPHPPAELVDELSAEKRVRNDTPPTFIWHTAEDPSVAVENSLLFGMALRAHKVPFDLHIYEKGPHGLGLGKNAFTAGKFHPWTDDLTYFLRGHGFLK